MPTLEGEFLQGLGLDYLHALEQLSISIFFYGVFVVLFSASFVIFIRRGFPNRTTAAMFAATFINFSASSLKAGNHVAGFVVFVRTALMDHPLSEKPEVVNDALRKTDIVTLWAAIFPTLLSDLIVIWRAWVLFPDRQWIIFIPFFMWIGTSGVIVGGLTWLSIPHDYEKWGSRPDLSLTIASLTLSIATNAVTTMMVAYKLWSYRTFIVRTLRLSWRKTPVQTVLILLVESGLVYLVFQIAYLVCNVDGNAIDLKANPFSAVYFSLSAMYPTLVIILVETQRSMTDGHLSLAVRPVYSTMERSRASQSHCEQDHGLEEVMQLKDGRVGISG